MIPAQAEPNVAQAAIREAATQPVRFHGHGATARCLASEIRGARYSSGTYRRPDYEPLLLKIRGADHSSPLRPSAPGVAGLPDSEETATALARQARLKLRLTLCPGRASLDTRVIRGFSGSD